MLVPTEEEKTNCLVVRQSYDVIEEKPYPSQNIRHANWVKYVKGFLDSGEITKRESELLIQEFIPKQGNNNAHN